MEPRRGVRAQAFSRGRLALYPGPGLTSQWHRGWPTYGCTSLLVQLQRWFSLAVGFSGQGIAVGAAQALVGVVQEELVGPVLPLCSWRRRNTAPLRSLENRGTDSHGGRLVKPDGGHASWRETAGSTGADRSSAGIFPEEPGSVLTKDELSIIYSMGSSSLESYGCQLRGALLWKQQLHCCDPVS